MTSRRRYTAVFSALCLGLAFVVGCGDGAYDEAVAADATIADQTTVTDLGIGDSGGADSSADGDVAATPDSSDTAAPDIQDVAPDAATLAKLEISKPAADAIVNPASVHSCCNNEQARDAHRTQVHTSSAR